MNDTQNEEFMTDDTDDEFEFIGCESFDPSLESASSLFFWYKAGQT